jgi:hypothetical protein
MSVFVIGDLHLSFNEDKPMSVFGENWENHEEKIRNNWREKVKENDLVVLPGDFSWSMYLKDTYKDFAYLNSLPGVKLLLKGNHDYWWTTVTNMRKFIKENNFKNIDFIQNNFYEKDGIVITGTRGWNITENSEDVRLIKREALRLNLSLEKAYQQYKDTKEYVVFMHYPPLIFEDITQNKENEFIKIMKKFNVKRCFYGHLHGISIKDAIEGMHFGIEFKLVSADALDFQLISIDKINAN